MRYYPVGGHDLPRIDGAIALWDADQRSEFWDSVEGWDPGLSDACGCYVFAIRVGGGVKPWYVGKAERQSFKRECLTHDKLKKYESALRFVRKGTPLLFFYARLTEGKRAYSAPSTSRHRDVSYLEKLLISHALKRNRNLINKQETKLLKQMVVPGMMNTEQGKLSNTAVLMKQMMGY